MISLRLATTTTSGTDVPSIGKIGQGNVSTPASWSDSQTTQQIKVGTRKMIWVTSRRRR